MKLLWFGVLIMMQGLLPGPAHAQANTPALPDGRSGGIAATYVRFSESLDSQDLCAITGPTLSLSWWGRESVGVDLALTYLPPSGRYDLTGGIAEIGAAFGLPASRRSALLLRAGLSGTAGANNDGGYMLGGGGYLGAGVLVRIHSRLALRTDGTARLTRGDAPSAVSVGVGLTLLP